MSDSIKKRVEARKRLDEILRPEIEAEEKRIKDSLKRADYTYEDTWNRRIASLDGMTYEDYLKSDHWKRVKYKASKRPNYQMCEFCDSTKVELHHKTYKWINTKFELSAIIAVCREHHQEIHYLAKENKISVRKATIEIKQKYRGSIEYRTNSMTYWKVRCLAAESFIKNYPINNDTSLKQRKSHKRWDDLKNMSKGK